MSRSDQQSSESSHDDPYENRPQKDRLKDTSQKKLQKVLLSEMALKEKLLYVYESFGDTILKKIFGKWDRLITNSTS